MVVSQFAVPPACRGRPSQFAARGPAGWVTTHRDKLIGVPSGGDRAKLLTLGGPPNFAVCRSGKSTVSLYVAFVSSGVDALPIRDALKTENPSYSPQRKSLFRGLSGCAGCGNRPTRLQKMFGSDIPAHKAFAPPGRPKNHGDRSLRTERRCVQRVGVRRRARTNRVRSMRCCVQLTIEQKLEHFPINVAFC